MRRTIFSICILLCCMLAAASLLVNRRYVRNNTQKDSIPGIYYFHEDTSPYLVDFYLCGAWEYYPGVLLYESPANFQAGIGTLNPVFDLDEAYDPQIPEVHGAQDSTNPDSFYAQLSSQSVTLPITDLTDLYTHSLTQPSSYRMVVEGLPPIDDFIMILSFQGLVLGDFEVYIDGHLTSAMVAPYGYPLYYFPVGSSGRVEFVIQTIHTSSLLNLVPRISFQGTGMGDFDTYRNILLVLAAMLVTSFLIMMILLFSLEGKSLYLSFFMGLLFTVSYLIYNLWATGYQGSLTAILPQYLLAHFAWLMMIAGVLLACIYNRKIYPDIRLRRLLNLTIVCISVTFILRVTGLFLTRTAFWLLLSDLLTALVILLLLVISFLGIRSISRSAFLFQIGFVLMVTGAFVSMIQNIHGFWNLFLYVQPLSIITYMILIFYNNKSNQRRLLKRTQELLELEKQSAKIQTAMLSSQIQPHFLYNTLTSIQELCYSDPDEAADLIVTFSQYLRTNLDFMNYDELVPFHKELEHIHNFMYIQNARYKDAIRYTEDLEFTDFLVPPLSVEPIVENAVKHGIMKENAHGEISLNVYRENGLIHILVKNNGTKFTAADLKKGHSMDNIQTRLNYLVNGQILFHFEDDSPETCVEVIFPG